MSKTIRVYSAILVLVCAYLVLPAQNAGTTPIFTNPDLNSLSEKLAKDIERRVGVTDAETIRFSAFTVRRHEDSLVGAAIAESIAEHLHDRSGSPCIVDIHAIEAARLAEMQAKYLRSNQVSKSWQPADYVVEGEVKVFRTNYVVTIQARRDGSSIPVFSSSRRASRTPFFDELILLNAVPETETATVTQVRSERRDERRALRRTAKSGEKRKVFTDTHSIEPTLATIGTIGLGEEWIFYGGACSYVRQLNTEFPLSLGLWLGFEGAWDWEPPISGGAKIVFGNKSEGFACALNIGWVPTVGFYYKNTVINLLVMPGFIVGGGTVVFAEIGYSFNL